MNWSRPATSAAVLLAGAAGTAVLYDGGFSPAPRLVFAGLAGAALVWAAIAERAAVGRLAREPVVLVLWALGLLGAASAAWTEGFAGDAVRWGLVTAGYGAVVVSAAALMRRRRRGVEAIAVAICLVAALSGVIGLVGVALHAGPFAERTGGAWRPGGTLEYSPALALLQVSALPILLSAICGRARGWAVAGLVGGAISASVVVLAGSRAELALAAAICALAILAPGRTVRTGRARVVCAVLALAAAGTAAHFIAGGYSPPEVKRAHAAKRISRVHVPARIRAGIEPSSGFTHGRPDAWLAAVKTFADHPWRGAGADAFLAASARHQRHGPVRFAHDLPLELAAELGLAGAILALLLYATSATALWRTRAQPAAWLLGPAVAAFLLANLIDWPWHLAGSGAVWALALGGAIGVSRAPTTDSS